MEVHAHSHSSRKKWTHYFWEFLMLFLAVFCGFLAENIREHQIEHNREKKYMISLLTDLRNDSTSLAIKIGDLTQLNKGLDTLIHALKQPLTEKKNLDFAFMMFLKYGMTGVATTFSENTMSQLKNGGGMRLIRKSTVLSEINRYEQIKSEVTALSTDTWKLVMDIENRKADYIFDFTGDWKILFLLEKRGLYLNSDSLMQIVTEDNIIPLSTDPGQIAIFRNSIRSSKSMFINYQGYVEYLSLINRELSAAIKKDYHLK